MSEDRSTPTPDGKAVPIEEALHHVLTRYGVPSRASEHAALVTDLIHWAADACRTTNADLRAQLSTLTQEIERLTGKLSAALGAADFHQDRTVYLERQVTSLTQEIAALKAKQR